MQSKKIKIPLSLLVANILILISMYAVGAYKDITGEECTGFAGASSACVEEYFFGYLLVAYLTTVALLAILTIKWMEMDVKRKKESKKIK